MDQTYDELDFAKTLRSGDSPVLGGRYKVLRELGHGGMGSVYLAEDIKLDAMEVAIKVPSAILVKNERVVRDLKREAKVAMRLSHPAIVALRGFEQTADHLFLVMDYIDGKTLDKLLIEKGTLTPDEAVELLKPIADALDYAHSQGVIHRDLKPSNILIDKQGRPYLTDFGIAREMKDTLTRITGKSDTSGTLPYMSPEQVNGEAPTPAQDIYSFGALIYECLVGHPPFFRGQIEHQILNKAADAEALKAKLGPSQEIIESLLSCLEKTPGFRPTDAGSVFISQGRNSGILKHENLQKSHADNYQKVENNSDSVTGDRSEMLDWPPTADRWFFWLLASLIIIITIGAMRLIF